MSKEKEQSVAEKVLTERNFVSSTIDPNVAKNISNIPVFSETRHGTVRIEGEVTTEKFALAREFEELFAQATNEIMDLAAYKPSDEIMDLVDSGKVDEARVAQMKAAPPWTAFQVGSRLLMKTPDGKLEEVKSYCFRLEKAVLTQVSINKQKDDAHKNALNFVQEQLNDALAKNKALQRYVDGLRDKVQTKLPQIFKEEKSRSGRPSLWLSIRPFSRRIKTVLLKIFGEEINNG